MALITIYLFKSYNAIGDRENAMVYAEKYMNKMQKVDNTQLAVDEVKEKYDLQMQQQQLESEHHVKRLRLYLLIAILVIALLDSCAAQLDGQCGGGQLG